MDTSWQDVLGGQRAVAAAACLHELFEAQAARTPAAVAVQCEGVALSYRQLNGRANRLAWRLREAGVGRETLVALYLERSIEAIVAILAVLKAGGAYVPIDVASPPARVGYVLEDTGAPVVLTQAHLRERLPLTASVPVCVDGDEAGLESQDVSAGNPAPLAGPDDLAYVIYTSGSTGRPKGVLVEHRQVTRLFSSTRRWFSPGVADTWSLLHSYAFDFSVWEIWGALLHGGRLLVVPGRVVRSPAALAELLAREQVTVLNATPSLFLAAMDALLARAKDLRLRMVVFGGEALSPPKLRPWFERVGDRRPRLINMYGITETTVHVTYRPLRRQDADREASPIGEAIPDLELHLLDEAMRPVPRGGIGELYVGGAGVARGYLNRPDLTAERFVPNPFGPGRLYRSGDRARRRTDGTLDYIGRLDNQVKLRGFRIELGEIEAALAAHPDVADAVVVLHREGAGAELAGYAVPRSQPLAAADLRRFVAERVPEYMVPSTVTILPALPLTANGKLDRHALPDPVRRRSADKALVAPRSSLERRLLAMWERELGIHPIGVRDDLFDLGVSSLVAAKLLTKIESTIGRRLPVGAIFRAPSIESLARLLNEGGAGPRWTSLVPIRTEGSRPPLFCLAPGDGPILPFARLARSLHRDQPVYALQPPGLYGRGEPLTTVEDFAAHYLSEMREVHADGPWCLAGLCFGGIVAYEIAQRLRADGEHVGVLALFNAPTSSWTRQWGWYGTQPHIAGQHEQRLALTRGQRLARAAREPRRFWTAAQWQVKKRVPAVRRFALSRGDPVTQLWREDHIHVLALEAYRAYEPEPYAGELLDFQGRGLFADPDLGWSELVDDVRTLFVPGDHVMASQLLGDPAVQWTARRLEGYLAEARM